MGEKPAPPIGYPQVPVAAGEAGSYKLSKILLNSQTNELASLRRSAQIQGKTQLRSGELR
jgi:hypothetical protein